MKKILVPALCLGALVAGGLWFLARRGPAGAPPAETTVAFKAEAFGLGTLMQYADGQTPLRALRWLPPLSGGIQAVQVLTQGDRQGVVLFQHGAMLANFVVPRPSGVREGFFNFAELRDVIVLPGDVAVLLYRSADATSAEMPLIIAMDFATQAPRWVHRAIGERIALGGDSKNGSVFLFGPTTILRLPLALQKGERINDTPFRPGLKAMALPEEIQAASDLLPTGSWSFLLAHAGGLSSFAERKGWQHWSTPSAGALSFPDARPTLAQGKGYWWQPFPGRIIQIKADGTPMASFDAATLAPAEPWARDGALLKLCGADPSGNLWFSLAIPASPSSVATPEPPPSNGEASDSESKGKAWNPEGALTAAQDDWNVYCSKGLERVYRWNPEHRAILGRALAEAWGALALPPNLNRPSGLQNFHPESGHILVESGPVAWFLPLEALPLGPASSTRKGQVM